MKHRTELLRLFSALADGQLSPEEHGRLQELLADPAARRMYLEYIDLHARLLTHPDLVGERQLPAVDALAGAIGEEAAAQIAAPCSARSIAMQSGARHLKRLRRVSSYVAVAIAAVAATML